jgi:RNA ligase (TIGR02306 family)
MERQLATIQEIIDLQPIPGADNIEVATVLGWHCVVKKGEFSIGNKCCYIECDAVVPNKPEFEFLKPRRFRVRTIKLRKQISQGLAMPLDTLGLVGEYEVGADVTDALEIILYEPNIPACLAGMVKGNFPSYIPKTSQARLQNNPSLLERFPDTSFRVTEKLDGTSFTCFVKDGYFGFCSRNLELDMEDESTVYKQMVNKYDLEARLLAFQSKNGWDIAIQGEVVGPGIQQNKYKLQEKELYLFDAYDISGGEYLDREDVKKLAEQLELKTVPDVMIDTVIGDKSVDMLVEMTDMKSHICPSQRIEGLIWTASQEQYVHRFGRLSFKVINPTYLLKCEN